HIGQNIYRASCQVANSSASQSRARLLAGPTFCWQTSKPEISIHAMARRLWNSCKHCTPSARLSAWLHMTSVSRSTPIAQCIYLMAEWLKTGSRPKEVVNANAFARSSLRLPNASAQSRLYRSRIALPHTRDRFECGRVQLDRRNSDTALSTGVTPGPDVCACGHDTRGGRA